MGDLLKAIEFISQGHSTWPMRDAIFLVLLAFNAWFIWKIGTNHLKHLDDRLDSIQKDVRDVRDRVSHLEGKLEN